MFINKIKSASKRSVAWFLTLIIALSAFICVPVTLFVSADDSDVNYFEVKSGAAWTSIIYITENVELARRGYYKFSFDFKTISGEPTFNIEGYDGDSGSYKKIADLDYTNKYSMTDVVENGITRRVVTVRLSKVITSLRITIGAYAEANDISCIFANPELYRYTSNFTDYYDENPVNLLKDLSEENVYDVMAEDPTHKSNKNDKWNLRYLTGNRNKIVYGTLTENEHKAKFAPPTYMIRLYEGNQNTFVEYLDNNVNLLAGKYTFNCDWKELKGKSDFAIEVSKDNGATFENVDAVISDAENSQRKVEFELAEDSNAIKITFGNPTDKSDVSIAFANPVLLKADSDKNLIESINESTVNLIGVSDAVVEEKWNIKRDADNEIAVDTPVVPENYFLDEKESLIYETYSGFPWVRMEYTENAVDLKAGENYIVSADFKLKGGTMENDKIGITDDPLFRVQVDTNNKMGLSTSVYLSQKHTDKFDGITTEFDEALGKIIIKFSPKADMSGVKFTVGNYCESALGACAIANPMLYEYDTKSNGLTVIRDNLIKNITDDTVHYPTEGKSVYSEIGKWNTVHLNNFNSFKLSSMQAGYFEPEAAYIKTLTGAMNNRVEYLDNTAVFKANTRYQLKFNYRVYSGEPQAFLSFKNIDGVEGEYVRIDSNTDFIKNFNDTIDEKTYTRAITFTPSKDISMLKFVVGNVSNNTDISVSIANARLYEVDEYDVQIGENIMKDINRPNIKRNSSDEKVWSLYSDANKDIIFTTPIPKDAYIAPRMIRIKAGNAYSRAIYYDDNVKLEANTTYRLSMDYKPLSGTPAFSLAFRNKNYKPASGQSDHQNIKNHSIDFKDWYDESTSIRYIEFTTKDDVSYLGGMEIVIGNTGEAKDIGCIFANPQFTKIVDGEIVGDNLINGITEETVQHMGNMSYNGTWNLRFTGTKNTAVVVEEIPNNYFRVPALITDGSIGSVTQFVTVGSNKSYMLSFDYKNEGGDEVVPYIEAFSKTASLGQITYSQVTKDQNGNYNYKCEFKTPNNLRENNNLRVGIKLDGVVASFSNFSLYELDKGFEKTGVNMLNNADFSKSKKLLNFDGTPANEWVFEGSVNKVAISYRGSSYFKIPVPQLYVFAGGSTGNYIYRESQLVKDTEYTLSLNLKYANPGYEGDTGVELLYNNGTEWMPLSATETESKSEFKLTYKFTMPSDSAEGNNMQFRVKAASLYTSGYLANAVLTVKGSSENLLVNGDFSNGTNEWKLSGSFKMTSLNDIPKNYFSKTEDTNHMIVYRNSGSWENIMQTYLTLKPDTYYLLKAEGVHPWEPIETSIYAIQVFYVKDGKDQQPFLGVKKSFKEDSKNTTCSLYKTPETLNASGNAYFRMVMQGVGNAGYFGSLALYESNEKGEILSNNVLINSDFALGEIGWTFSKREENYDYRIVEQPDDFFETYVKNDDKMIESTGTKKDASLGQTITVERGKKYYFTGHYVSMNSAGITPMVSYIDKNGKEQEYTLNSYYDSERFFFEIEFELPSDAYANRGIADVKFYLTNADNGKGYISDLALYEDGKYINLLKNSDFSNKFKNWETNANYKILSYDAGVFVFHYDDEKFNDGNWANENGTDGVLAKGQVLGFVLDENGNAVKDVEMLLKPAKYSVKTDENGQYLFENIDSGVYTLCLKDKTGKEHTITEVTVSNGICSNISILTLTLKKSEESNDITDDSLTNDENQDFVDDFDSETQIDDTNSGDLNNGEVESIQVDVNYGIVCGYLLDADGNPLKNVNLYIGKVGEIVTKDKGVFQFDKVRPGKYDIYTKNEDGTINVLKTVEVVAGKGQMYKLYLPDNSSISWVVIVLIVIGVVMLANAGLVVFIILKKKKAKFK